jgi:hypothetical protein
VILLAVGLQACTKFPELEVSEAQFDDKTPYPEFVPMDVLLKEPEATITDDVETDLTTRRDDLLTTPDAQSAQDLKDPVLDRIDALRERSQANAQNGSIFDDELRKRLEGGITATTVPE